MFLKTDGAGNLSFDSLSFATPLAVIGNATAGSEIRLPEDTDNGSNYVAIKAPDNLASNLTLTLPSADGTSGQVLQTNGSGVLSFAGVSASAGQVIQVVSTLKTDRFSTNASGETDITGLSVTITPSSTSNKILILAHITSSSNNSSGIHFRVLRGATAVGVGSDGSRTPMGFTTDSGQSDTNRATTIGAYCFLDTPSSTSSLTYKVTASQFNASNTYYINSNATLTGDAYDDIFTSGITAMEIKG